MIVGVGTDMVEVARIDALMQRFGAAFERKLFTPVEIALAPKTVRRAAHFAKRFAAKEACLKALGTGLAQGIRWHDIEILRAEGAAPRLVLRGAALERLDVLGGHACHVSLSDEKHYALAFVVLSA